MFAVPTLFSSVLQSLNGSINAIWVGRFLGESSLAATSNANLVMFLLMAFVFGFGMAATVLIGQAFGRKDIDGVRRVIGTAIGCFLPISVAIGVAGWLLAPALLHLLATPPESVPLALAYLRVIFIAMPPILVAIILMMGLRGTGDALTPLWFMIVAVVLDSGLNPVFILGLGPAPRLGIAGSATATVIANFAALAGILIYIYARDLPIRLRRRRVPLSGARSGDPQDDRRQGAADGAADDRHLLLGAGDARPGQPRGRRDDRRLRRRDAIVDLYPDAGDGAGRGGERDGGSEYRRGQMGAG